jgi:Thioredoxin reductase
MAYYGTLKAGAVVVPLNPLCTPTELTRYLAQSGAVAIVQGYEQENRVVVVHGRHQFLGELGLLTGSRVYLSAVVRDGGEVIQVPAERLRALLGEDEEMTNVIGQAAIFLSQHAAGCRLLIRGGDLGKSMSRYLVDEIERREGIEVLTHSEIVELQGETALEAAVVADNRSGTRAELPAKAVFVFIGASPHTGWLDGRVAMDEDGFLLTGGAVEGADLAAFAPDDAPYFLETSQPGIFAVGDVRSGSIKRVASGAGEGSMAVQLVHQRLAAR